MTGFFRGLAHADIFGCPFRRRRHVLSLFKRAPQIGAIEMLLKIDLVPAWLPGKHPDDGYKDEEEPSGDAINLITRASFGQVHTSV